MIIIIIIITIIVILELPVLHITQTVDLIVETLPTQKCNNTFPWPSSDVSLSLLTTPSLCL